MSFDTVKKYIRSNGAIKIAINDPVDGQLKFYKINLGSGKWKDHVFVEDITISSKRGETIKISDSTHRNLIYGFIVAYGIKECIDRYKRESTQYKMSTHSLDVIYIDKASQDEIEKKYIPFLWDRQVKDEKDKRITKYDNDIGFNKSDASFFSHIVKDILDIGLHLNSEQLENAKRRLCKYTKQFSEMP